jgi:hypothetical protein
MRERNPWSPTVIAVLTMVFSPLAGGVLHGLNCARLGQGHLRRFVLARNLLAGLLFLLLATAVGRLAPPIGVSWLFAAYFYKTQESGFQACLSEGREKGSLMAAILIALLTSLGAAVLILPWSFF